jgi:nucleotide-binding universal stress UspA family protein
VAGKFGSQIRLLHVTDDAGLAMSMGAFASNIGELLILLADAGEKILADAKRRAQEHGIQADTAQHNNLGGRVCDVIVKEAVSWKADLIVIGTHGRRGAGRLLLGSDAERVLRLAPVPVLLVRGSDAAA